MYSEIIPGFTKAVNEGLRDIRRVVKAAGVDHIFSEPTAIGWKVANLDELHQVVIRATDMGVEFVSIQSFEHLYAATIVMNSEVGGMRILKVIQRNSDSDDLLGLDHIDFFISSRDEIISILRQQSDFVLDFSSDGAREWISVDCDGREARLITYSELDIVSQQAKALKQDLPFKS